MSGRIFQNVVLQLKENTDRTVGVIDGEGIVIACSELAMIGQRWAEHVPAINAAGGAIVTSEGKTFKALNGWGTQFDYAAFAFGDNEISKTVCAMATVALNGAKNAAWLAAEILALGDEALAAKLEAERTAMAAQIAAKEEKLQAEIAEL